MGRCQYVLLSGNPSVFSCIGDVVDMAENLFPDALLNHARSPGVDQTELSLCEQYLDHYSKNKTNIPFYKNPELFNVLGEYVNNTTPHPDRDTLYKMGLQLGLHKTPDPNKFTTLRLYHFYKCIYTPEAKIELTTRNSLIIKDGTARQHIQVIMPLQNIFSGLIAETLYPANTGSGYRSASLTRSIEKSFDMINDYSPVLYADLFRIISYVFLTPDFHNKKRFSYNLRTGYLGAIFINKYQTSTISFAEALIHEFIHQRLWLQWSYTVPDMYKLQQTEVVSPFTNRSKTVPVMVHAYIIYTLIRDFHQYLLLRGNTGKREQQYLENSIKKAAGQLPVLYSRLLEKVPEDNSLHNILTTVYDHLNN
jgi:hypothetical protein